MGTGCGETEVLAVSKAAACMKLEVYQKGFGTYLLHCRIQGGEEKEGNETWALWSNHSTDK